MTDENDLIMCFKPNPFLQDKPYFDMNTEESRGLLQSPRLPEEIFTKQQFSCLLSLQDMVVKKTPLSYSQKQAFTDLKILFHKFQRSRRQKQLFQQRDDLLKLQVINIII